MRVLLGNPAPKEGYRDEDGVLHHRPVDGTQVTTVVIPDTYTLLEAVSAVVAQDGAWNHHTQGDNVSDVTPDWVESDHDTVGALLASHFGCPLGRPPEPEPAGQATAPVTEQPQPPEQTGEGR